MSIELASDSVSFSIFSTSVVFKLPFSCAVLLLLRDGGDFLLLLNWSSCLLPLMIEFSGSSWLLLSALVALVRMSIGSVA